MAASGLPGLPGPAVSKPTHSGAAVPLASKQEWQDIFALLDTALDLEPSAHAAWLAALGPEQAHLSPPLQQLLKVHALRGTDDFMQSAAVFALQGGVGSSDEPVPVGLAAQALVGPYRLLCEIGQGGMATVWLAERADGLLERQVALKLPHASWGGAPFADRMARERNILASLTHPNIARLYDAGVGADGRPFLALEYVDGVPIDAFSRKRRLGVRERLGLIVQVARAVAHAHARLVVHRDLKPSNILVDAQGQSHLLDFGIAKLIDPTLDAGDAGTQLTQSAVRALTPDYASPEQIRGEVIGTASDVYSLGVVAFELLVGERPYRLSKGLAAGALAQAMAQTDTPRASGAAADPAVARQLKGDIDAILARALAKASNERYATMDALADDIERHLRGQAVLARPDSRWYRAERWVRRHKLETAVGAAIVVAVPAGAVAQAAVLLAIAAGAGVSLWQARVARRQTQLAKEEAARAAAVKAFLTSFFKSGSLEEDGGAQLGRLTVRQFVERGARKIDLGFEHEPALKNELFDVVSTLFADLSDGAQTVAYARKWQSSLEQHGASRAEQARAAQRLAQGLALLGQHTEAVAVLEHAIARLRRGAPAPALLAHLLVDLAGLHGELGDTESAFKRVDEALSLLVSSAASGAAAAHGAALYMRADLMATRNQLADAMPYFERAITTLVRVHGERSTVVGKHRYLFATHLWSGQRTAASERELRHALQIFRDTGGEADLNAAIVETFLGRTLALTHDRRDQRSEGLQLLAHARTVLSSRVGDVSPHHAAQAHLYLAEGLIDDGELGAAREPMHACLTLLRGQLESPLQLSVAQVIHARLLSECGEYQQAQRVLEDVHAERLRRLGSDHPHTVSVTYRIGLVHLRRNDFGQAKAAFESLVDLEDQEDAVRTMLKRLARTGLALTQLEQGDAAQALPALQFSFDHYHANTESARLSTSEAEVSLNLGRAWLLSGDAPVARPLLQRAADVIEANHPRSPGLASNRCWLGLCCLALGDVIEARALADLARATLEAEPSAGIHYRRSLALLTDQIAAQPPAA